MKDIDGRTGGLSNRHAALHSKYLGDDRRTLGEVMQGASAAAIFAAGLLRLRRLAPDAMKGHFYWSAAVRILRSLCEKQLAKSDPEWEGILKGGVYHVPNGLGVDESVMWGEYFFCEALERVLW